MDLTFSIETAKFKVGEVVKVKIDRRFDTESSITGVKHYDNAWMYCVEILVGNDFGGRFCEMWIEEDVLLLMQEYKNVNVCYKQK
jgi:hypothetical protein